MMLAADWLAPDSNWRSASPLPSRIASFSCPNSGRKRFNRQPSAPKPKRFALIAPPGKPARCRDGLPLEGLKRPRPAEALPLQKTLNNEALRS